MTIRLASAYGLPPALRAKPVPERKRRSKPKSALEPVSRRESRPEPLPPPPQPADVVTLPARISPMLATAAEPFDSPEHQFEVKWDGTRCLAFIDGPDKIRLQNRRDIEMRSRYPELAVLRGVPAGTVLDGEIIVLEDGRPSFPRLQQREHLLDPRRIEIASQRIPATLMAFDLLYLRGVRLYAKPLSERRALLEQVVGELGSPHVLAPEPILEQGRALFSWAEQNQIEGIIAKRLSSPYLPGRRSTHWNKIKVAQTAVFEVIGFTPREDGRPFVSALIIGERSGSRWVYKGKVGSGFNEEDRAALFAALSSAPLLEKPPRDGPADAVWRMPGLRCAVRFFEKTAIGMLRAPVFKGFVGEGQNADP